MCYKCLNVVKFGGIYEFDEHRLTEINLASMWHYTSVNAFINIIKSKQIRFTDCLFLNDTKEFNYIFGVLNKYVENKLSYFKEIQNLLQQLEKNNKDFLPLKNDDINGYHFDEGRYYILSGSAESDLLPLWNYYCNRGQYDGYSLKLDITKICELFCEYGQGLIYVGNVVYDLNEQLQIIETVVKVIFDDYFGKIKSLVPSQLSEEEYDLKRDELKQDTYGNLYEFINECRLFFKDSSFSYEKELRIAVLASTKVHNNKKFEVFFDSINGIIKPSIALTFNAEVPIKEVKISPLIDLEMADLGIRRLLEDNQITTPKDFKIEKSKLSIRY